MPCISFRKDHCPQESDDGAADVFSYTLNPDEGLILFEQEPQSNFPGASSQNTTADPGSSGRESRSPQRDIGLRAKPSSQALLDWVPAVNGDRRPGRKANVEEFW